MFMHVKSGLFPCHLMLSILVILWHYLWGLSLLQVHMVRSHRCARDLPQCLQQKQTEVGCQNVRNVPEIRTWQTEG